MRKLLISSGLIALLALGVTPMSAADPPGSGKNWGPFQSKDGLAAAEGDANGSGFAIMVLDDSRARAICGWALITATATDGVTKERVRSCGDYTRSGRIHPGLTTLEVKVCSGTKKRVRKSTCRSYTVRDRA